MSVSLGTLEKVDPREAWPKEDENFTPWLASPEGLKLLGDTLGVQLEREAEEHAIGSFKADILARRTDTPEVHWVVIENQLEKTDHLHLGQLLTYAAGVKAATIIWVATQLIDQHRAAIDWLNEITGDGFQFFGLEIELWRIGASPLAPKLNIVARPNDWSRSASEAKKTEGVLSELGAQRVRYWAGVRDALIERKSPLRAQKPSRDQWYNFALGRAGFVLSASTNVELDVITVGCHMVGKAAPGWYGDLLKQREGIEAELGPLEWDQKDGRDLHKIMVRKTGADPEDEKDWPQQHAWLAESLTAFAKVFGPLVKALPGLTAYTPGAVP